MAKKSIFYLVTQSEWGGAQRYIFDLATNLDAQKYQVMVAAGEDPNGLLFKKLREQGIKTFYLKYLKRAICPYADGRAFFEIRKLISQIKPDIIHLNSSKAGVLGSLAAKLRHPTSDIRHPTIIYTVHGWVFNEPLPWWLKKFYFWAEKISAKWKDKIICVSEFDRQMALKTRLCRPEKLVTIHNGIDINQMEFLSKEKSRTALQNQGLPLRSPAPKIFGAGRSRAALGSKELPLIGTIAHFYPTKGLQYLIEAAKIILNGVPTKVGENPCFRKDSIIFAVIGNGPERPKLEKLIKKYHLENNFFLLGEIPQAAQYLKAFDIFVLPSVKEGFPYTILEAMAAQVPIIATQVGGVPEMINDPSPRQARGKLSSGYKFYGEPVESYCLSEAAKGGRVEGSGLLVRPKNSQSLAEKIIYLLEHPEIAQRLAQKARQKVEKEFSLEKMIWETEKLYRGQPSNSSPQ